MRVRFPSHHVRLRNTGAISGGPGICPTRRTGAPKLNPLSGAQIVRTAKRPARPCFENPHQVQPVRFSCPRQNQRNDGHSILADTNRRWRARSICNTIRLLTLSPSRIVRSPSRLLTAKSHSTVHMAYSRSHLSHRYVAESYTSLVGPSDLKGLRRAVRFDTVGGGA